MSAAKISEVLNLTSLKDKQWHIQVRIEWPRGAKEDADLWTHFTILDIGMLGTVWRRVRQYNTAIMDVRRRKRRETGRQAESQLTHSCFLDHRLFEGLDWVVLQLSGS
jgi:hypothetical protein